MTLLYIKGKDLKIAIKCTNSLQTNNFLMEHSLIDFNFLKIMMVQNLNMKVSLNKYLEHELGELVSIQNPPKLLKE
jgi:hypothetical protein